MLESVKSWVARGTPDRIDPLLQGMYYSLYPPEPDETRLHSPSDVRGLSPEEFPYEDVFAKVDVAEPVIVDGGAHTGDVTETFLDLFSSATVHAVEPVPRHFADLEEQFGDDERVTLHNAALGAVRGETTINVYEESASSSIHESSEAHRRYGGDDKTTVEKTVTKPMVRIDDIVTSADIIKLDLQGHELPALRGASNALDSCKAVVPEISFVPLYKRQPLYCDIEEVLTERNFHVYDFYMRWEGPDGEITHGDAVFFDESVYRNGDFDVNPFAVDEARQ